MYNSLQEQLSEIHTQLNFILTTLAQVSCEVGIHKERLNITDSDIKTLLATILEITNDSDTKKH
jgi:hypothetical protein